ncbi:DUF4340 domain-containing protein [Temperatibacter marinus]|uniref:DUF4340 domain-containing protein n=1 Tax=Temperatibacter marinus TaxID=1456591 RepID=A0AA52EJ94_9PROT|nr:DUF4340 domain-containing protein [Temperatibacter marinus]WND03299.1 DUF4340 domain-containing protein [Temperatibacter marinus]
MSMRMTDFLGYLTLFVLLWAIWILFGEDPNKHQGGRGEIFLEGLSEKANDISSFSLTKDGESLHITKQITGWSVSKPGAFTNFPVKEGAVSSFVSSLMVSERAEPKTTDENRFPKLDLGHKATEIKILGTAGQEIKTFQLGRHREIQGKSISYVYQPSDTRAWMVRGMPTASVKVSAWVSNPVISIQRNQIQSMTLKDGTEITHHEGTLSLRSLTEKETLVEAFEIGLILNSLAQMTVTDILDASDKEYQRLETVHLTLTDGQVITAETVAIKNEIWIKISGEADLAPWLFKLSNDNLARLMSQRSDLVIIAAPAS